MDLDKSLDEVELIAALLRDVQNAHGEVFNTRALRLTITYVKRRTRTEGLSFLTKTLPRLGKALDRCLAGDTVLNPTELGFKTLGQSKLPRFLGELFSLVLQPDGALLPLPCAKCVKDIRLILYCFYKYKLPYTDEQEQQVIQKFKRTEDDLSTHSARIAEIANETAVNTANCRRGRLQNLLTQAGETSARDCLPEVVREARILLNRVFSLFDPLDIHPKHGPGAVATQQQLSAKYVWTNVSGRITHMYPLDAYFFASLGHVCDRRDRFESITDRDLPARVLLVPKDSRGPRLISCEPVDFQWIQQGLGKAIVEHVELHPATRWNVFFTDQSPNGRGALLGSSTGRYSTLDLNEASDRVSVDLVRLLFPEHLLVYLEACRSLSTVLPDGEVLPLRKFAPMGSSLCFPVLALTIWAILTAGAPDADTRDGILVYGDDVIVPTAYAVNAMELLESFGLKINRDKSCISGLFRESCGIDAFNGVNVTPVRFRTVWSSSRRPDVYTSWISYANSLWSRQCYHAYDLIVSKLLAVYGKIPSMGLNLSAPSLWSVPTGWEPTRKRWNKALQKAEYLVYDVKSPSVIQHIDGWSQLLRFFAEVGYESPINASEVTRQIDGQIQNKRHDRITDRESFSVSKYTSRRASMLVRRWR
jgi:hypothetical protein